MVYEDTAERHRFDSFCKVVLRHAMLDCFREFSCQNKWLVSLTSPAANASGYLKRSRPKSYVRDWRRQNRLPILIPLPYYQRCLRGC